MLPGSVLIRLGFGRAAMWGWAAAEAPAIKDPWAQPGVAVLRGALLGPAHNRNAKSYKCGPNEKVQRRCRRVQRPPGGIALEPGPTAWVTVGCGWHGEGVRGRGARPGSHPRCLCGRWPGGGPAPLLIVLPLCIPAASAGHGGGSRIRSGGPDPTGGR